MKLINFTIRKKLFILCLLICLMICAVMQLNTISAYALPTKTNINLICEINIDNITLKWNAITHEKGVKGYYVYRSTTSGGQTILPETDFWISGTSYVDKKVTPGTTYYYIVKPVLADGYTGKASNEIKAYYKGAKLLITLKAKVNTDNITLEWSDSYNNDDIVGYYVYRANSPGGQTSLPETDFWITGNSYKDTKVVPGSTYYYIVKPALKDKTLGKASNEVSAKYSHFYGTISMTLGEKKMLVNGKWLEIDPGKNTVPVLKNARTMLPIRALIESMGGTVDYVSGEQKITVKWNGKTVCVWIGKTSYKVDGVKKTMDVAPYYSDTGRTMIPMRFIIENLGCNIEWDGSTRTATVSYLLDNNNYGTDLHGWDGVCDENNYNEYLRKLSKPADFSGTWSIKGIGKLIIQQKDNIIEGSLGNKERITGSVSNNKFTGTYIKGKKTLNIEIYMLEDNESLIGHYGDSDTVMQKWTEFTGDIHKSSKHHDYH